MTDKERLEIAEEALKLLSPIHYSKWMVYTFTNEKNKCCAIGHYQRLKSSNPENYSFANCEDFMSSPLRNAFVEIASVNNNLVPLTCRGKDKEYIEKYSKYKTPKTRVIKYLKDQIKELKQKIKENGM